MYKVCFGAKMSPVRKIAYLGGSFDPVHEGHIAMAEAALASGKCDEVWFGCAWIPPHKQKKPVSNIVHRINMTALALEGRAGLKVCDFEARMQFSPSYSFDVLSALQEKWPQNEFCMLIGADSLMSLHTWYQAAELVRKFSFLSVRRPGFKIDREMLKNIWKDEKIAEKLLEGVIESRLSEAASTKIRKNFDQAVVLPEIRAYIELCRLYKNSVTVEE